MIKLKELLYETSDIPSVDGAGQLWPFAEKATYAKDWESSRMEDLFGGSLLGMERGKDDELAYITSIEDVDDFASHKPAGNAGEHWHEDANANILGDWEFVKYMFDMDNVDRVASDEPMDTPSEVESATDRGI
tara:strand:+ start:76391 stop:76789 length:399 start_codon:yes stop_codon:yes gene_type:complete